LDACEVDIVFVYRSLTCMVEYVGSDELVGDSVVVLFVS